MKRALAALAFAGAEAARAHALQDRYDLPLPMAYVVAAGCAAVALTFLLASSFAPARATAPAPKRALRVPHGIRGALRTSGLLLFAVTLASALWGTGDPLMNLAPTMTWIVWWLGMTFLSAFVVDAWPLLDPWRTLDAGLRKLTRRGDPLLHWPARLGCWPAAVLLLGWCWLEVVRPLATSPHKLGLYAVAWTLAVLAGMQVFGRGAWRANVDPFALAFATFGRLAPLRLEDDPPAPDHGWPAFVLALLATVLFDGLHASPVWVMVESLLRKAAIPLDRNGLVAGTLGLLAVWGLFVASFEGAAAIAARVARPAQELRVPLALTLLPIAVGYAVAHNFSTFVLQGQRVFALLSDPLGRGWNLFGTANVYPDIALLDARAIWFIATFAVVTGHAASVWASHRVVLAAGVPRRRAAVALLPLTLLMLAMTAASLLLLAGAD